MTSMAPSRAERSAAEIVTEGDARDALDLVSRICREVGPGVPGSPQERKRAEIIRRELEPLHSSRSRFRSRWSPSIIRNGIGRTY